MSSPESEYGKSTLHVHTPNSDGRGTIVQSLGIAKEKNIQIIAFADHDRISDEAKNLAARSFKSLEVAVAIEITSPAHILALFLNDNYPTTAPEMFMGIPKTIEWIKKYGGYAVLAHPGIPFGVKPNEWSLFDAVELFSPVHKTFKRDQQVINAFLHIPKENRPAPLSTGDIHFPKGRNWNYVTLFQGKTLSDLEKAIIDKSTVPYIENFGLPEPSILDWAIQIPYALFVEPFGVGRIQASIKHYVKNFNPQSNNNNIP
jgi:hypothetical protein